jgi:acyl-coenzyme A thioesterase PaaI-like protein
MKKQPTSRLCFVCGESNPAGVHVRFYEQEDGSVLARFTGQEHHQGYPGRMHGGVITAIMDETMGRAIMIPHPAGTGLRGETVWGVTAELNLRFRRPVPLGVELIAAGRIVSENARFFEGRGELYLPDGTVAVEGTGKYIKLDISKIGNFDPVREQWGVRPDR